MSDPVIDRSRMPQPSEPAAGYQRWSNLAFVHWRVPPELLRPLIPQPLAIDTWHGDAWLGVIAFAMSGVRPAWAPPLPYLSAFPETNLRTYVHLHGTEPGVWFFSLDASRWLAVQAARLGWGLNYRWSRMRVMTKPTGSDGIASVRAAYHSRRWFGEPCQVDMELSFPPSPTDRAAEPDTLDYFLCERYRLYTLSRDQRLLTARVHHTPYPLIDARLLTCKQTLTESIGFQAGWPEHVLFSPGVQVSVYPLQPAENLITSR